MNIWSRNFTTLFISNFLMSFSFYLIIITLPIFANRNLLVEDSKIGLIILTLSSSAIIGRILSNYLLNYVKEYSLYLGSFIAFSIFASSFYFVDEFYHILTLMPFFGLSFGLVSTVVLKIATELIPKERRAEGVGYFIMNMSLAMALAPFIASLLYRHSFSYVFLTVIFLLVIAIYLSVIVDYRSEIKKEKINLSLFFDKKLLPIFFISIFTLNGYGAIFSFLDIFANSKGIENASLFFLVYSASISITRPIGGKIFDKYGHFNLMVISFIALAFGLFMLSNIETLSLLLISSAFIGVGYGVLSTSFFALAINQVGEKRKNLANSMIFISIDVGIGCGSFLAGVISTIALDYIFKFSSMLIILSLILFILQSFREKGVNAVKIKG